MFLEILAPFLRIRFSTPGLEMSTFTAHGWGLAWFQCTPRAWQNCPKSRQNTDINPCCTDVPVRSLGPLALCLNFHVFGVLGRDRFSMIQHDSAHRSICLPRCTWIFPGCHIQERWWAFPDLGSKIAGTLGYSKVPKNFEEHDKNRLKMRKPSVDGRFSVEKWQFMIFISGFCA